MVPGVYIICRYMRHRMSAIAVRYGTRQEKLYRLSVDRRTLCSCKAGLEYL